MSRVVIIGAGVAGVCSAYYAALRGQDVTVLDRNAPDHPGCSYGNAGMIVPSHFVPLAAPGMVALGLKWMWNPESPFWIKPRLDSELAGWAWKFWRASTAEQARRAAPVLRDLHMASRALFEEMARAAHDEFGLVKRGLLMLCKTDAALEEEARVAIAARKLKIPAEVLAPDEAAALDPGIRMDIAGAVYFPRDCHLAPGKFMDWMKGRAASAGAKFLYETDVAGVRREGRAVRAVMTSRGEIEGDEFVLCAGAWSAGLARELGLKLPMQAGKGYSLTLPNPPRLPEICAILTEARVAVTPMGGTLRVGGTMELAGLDESIDPRRVRGIIKAMPEYYPEFRTEDFEGIEPWRGLRPCSPDGLPYLGRTRRLDNVVIATGHAMMGLSLGPVTGQMVAGILSGENPAPRSRLLDPDRFG